MSLPHGEATFYSQAILECAIAAIVCIADMIIGIVGEWLCQIPPIDGPESPKMKTGHATQSLRGRGYQISDTIESLIASLLQILFGNAKHHLLCHAATSSPSCVYTFA